MNQPAFEIRLFDDANYGDLPRLFALLEPQLPATTVAARIAPMRAQGWRCIGAFANGELLAMAGFGQRHHLFSGPVMYVENLVVLPAWRAHGLGARMMAWIETLAHELGCTKVTLDAYAVNQPAQAFYRRLQYEPRGVHFVKELH